jgi:hypothetical protein
MLSEIQSKLNAEEMLPPKAFRRDVLIYELVSYVNHITGCHISKNFKAIPIFIERARNFMETNPANSKSNKYYLLVTDYFLEIEQYVNEKKL